MAVSGAEYILVPPPILNALSSEVTTAGYNDGLHVDEGKFKPALSPKTAQEVPLMPQLTTASAFNDALPMVASAILKSSLKQEDEERSNLLLLLSSQTTPSE